MRSPINMPMRSFSASAFWGPHERQIIDWLIGFVAFAVNYGGVAPASATIVNAEWTGTITNGVDGLEIFGPAGADLSGAAFTGDMLYDTALGTTLYSSPTGTWLEGGPGVASGGQSPILTASLTINGITHAITPNFYGQVLATNGQPNIVNEIYQSGASSVDNDNIFFAMYNTFSQVSGDIPGTIDVPLTYYYRP